MQHVLGEPLVDQALAFDLAFGDEVGAGGAGGQLGGDGDLVGDLKLRGLGRVGVADVNHAERDERGEVGGHEPAGTGGPQGFQRDGGGQHVEGAAGSEIIGVVVAVDGGEEER